MTAKSPEQKVREFYEAFAEAKETDDSFGRGVSYAIEQTLKMLGIKIEGVNADE